MNIAKLEEDLNQLLNSYNKESFIYDLLLIYGLPKTSISRLKNGNLNLSKIPGEISWKKKLYYKEENVKDLHLTITEIKSNLKHDQRFIIVTDFDSLLAIDTKTNETLDIKLQELSNHYDFFLPWSGIEKAQHHDENPADVKAAEKMAKLFDEIKKDNPDSRPEFIHGLNVFLSRILFCFFAEDTNIFTGNQFINALDSHTNSDGSDLTVWFDEFFQVLNIKNTSRGNIPSYLNDFPYVNGGLFRDKHIIPKFTRRSRQAIIDSGQQDWSKINPDIFGSMMQAAVSEEQRGGLGMHYTSVPNIMKVIKPLFLDELYEELENAGNHKKKLESLLFRISKIKIFDPACGSGNFLIIAYKELRKLEITISKRIGILPWESVVKLKNFYGIEIDDFAHEVAQLSLWLAEHQMNVQYYKEFGKAIPTLPLKDEANIIHGNACRIDWEIVCPKTKDDEVYILGNPPYQGFKMQNSDQKKDMEQLFKLKIKYKKLDYITCWFFKAALYVSTDQHAYSFVSTNSICQGEHVGLLWPELFKHRLCINFAYTTFKWSNNAKSKAGVSCIIVGVTKENNKKKYLYTANSIVSTDYINAYLTTGREVIVYKRSKVLSRLPRMFLGNMPKDDGNLILTDTMKNDLLIEFPHCKKYVRELIGANEMLNGTNRWCLWIKEEELLDAIKNPLINSRIRKVEEFRLKSSDNSANEMAKTPYKFREQHEAKNNSIIIPTVTSERREYVPMAYLEGKTVIVAPNNAIYDPETYIFSLLSSKMHIIWVKAVSGKLESRIRYSSVLCYNTFPFPIISDQKKQELSRLSFVILEEREKNSEKTLAQLYDPDKMPEGLREAHYQNDLAVERCYRSKPFESDEERLEYLFNLYEKMIAEEKNKKNKGGNKLW